MALEKIALFPIPEMVSFPFTSVPLHVFEPRYRNMIKECVKNNIKIAVCHTLEKISDVPMKAETKDVYNMNLTTFKPAQIFSAGYCTIDDVTADGRFKVHIDMDTRYKIVEMVQELPYFVAMCEEYKDLVPDMEQDFVSSIRTRIDKFLIEYATSQSDTEFLDYLKSSSWQGLPDSAYSFKVFEKIKFQGKIAQNALEKKSSYQRLKVIDETLNLSKGLS